MDCVFFSEADRKLTIGELFCYYFHGIFIQKEGRAKISIDNEISSLNKGSFIFLRANQVREWIAVTPDFSGYLLSFENEFIETFFKDNLFVHRFQFFQTNQPAILKCNDPFLLEHINSCEKIRAELDNLQDDSHHYIRSLMYTIFIYIDRSYIKEYNLLTKLHQDSISLRFRKSWEENIFTDTPNFWVNQPSSSQKALELIFDMPANFEPDEGYEYSNTHYLLLTRIMDKVLGCNHFQFIKEEMLTPLNLTYV